MALLTLCGGLVLLMAGLLVLSSVTEVGVAAAMARTAADAAALAAVSTGSAAAQPHSAGQVSGCQRARALAEANGAHLDACRVPALGAVVVEVTVRPRSPLVRRLVGELPARAAAVLEPRTVDPAQVP